jgi:2-oxoisovalerate dehydrogenase E1 component
MMLVSTTDQNRGNSSLALTDFELRIFRKALLSQRVENALLELFREGELSGTVHTCIGQEFSGATISECLETGDSVFSNHRCHGHFLSVVGDTKGLVAEIMGKESGVCAGRGGSQHLCKERFYSNGIQGGGTPIATGVAFANKLRKNRNIVVSFIGDGTLGEGVVYEAMNLASKWLVPLLFVLEDNGIAQSTGKTETLAGDILKRAEAFGIETRQVSTWQWRDFFPVAKELADLVRMESRPGFLLVDTFRLRAHSKGDDTRPQEYVASHAAKDPLTVLLAIPDPKIAEIYQSVEHEVKTSVDLAKLASVSSFETLIPESHIRGIDPSFHLPESQRFIKALNRCFSRLMRENSSVLFIGEDVRGHYGGAFKASSGLTDEFPERVFNTPISEAAIIGLGTGLAMENFHPIVEIMFGDFLTLGFDQLVNHAAKFPFMFNYQTKTGLIVRTPMGGHRGYGPTHSQSLEKHFFGVPGLNVVALNNFMDPYRVYSALMSATQPTLVVENKIQYTTELVDKLPLGYAIEATAELLPTLRIFPLESPADLTLIAYGAMALDAFMILDRLFEEHDLIAQLICPTQIFPFELEQVAAKIVESKKIFVIEEGQIFSGFGAEIAAQLSTSGFAKIPRVKRIGAQPMPIPASRELEQFALPVREQILKTIAAEYVC